MATNATGTGTTSEPVVTDKQRIRFTRDEIPRLAGLLGFVAMLHIVGFGLFYYYNSQSVYHNLSDTKGTLIFAGAGALAYGFGLRHAFDADHISAIDDTTRYLLQKGKRPLGVGFFFSLGHSTIVLALSVGIAVAATAASKFRDSFEAAGGIIGTLVSAVFLYIIASLNLVVLVGIVKMWQAAKRGEYRTEELDRLLASRGLMNRIFKGRYNKFINHSWQLYPVGVLFGLGFDTATEVGLLGLSATAAVAGGLPALAIISLPILFAAGMSLMDTLDGVFMSKAYGWAFVTPIRKIYYNITTTGLSIFVAFVIGTIELVGLLAQELNLSGQPWDYISTIDINTAGRIIVGVFLIVWIGAVLYYKARHIDQRYAHLATDHPTSASGSSDAAEST